MGDFQITAIEVLKRRPREEEAKDIITRVARQVRQ
jgi:hypothetical protein